MRVEKLQQTFDVETVLVHFPLHPDTPAEGRSMAEFYASRNIDPEAAYQRMKGLMDAEGLPYGRRTHTYNSRLAQELGKWADTQPGGAALHDALYKAYFVEARNIGDPELLVELAASVGLPADEARAVLAERRNAGLRLLSGICSAQTCSAGPAAGPDADRLGAAAQFLIALVLQPFEERRLCR